MSAAHVSCYSPLTPHPGPRLGQPLIPSRSLGPGSQGPPHEYSRMHVCAHTYTLSPRKCMGTLTHCTGRHTHVWMSSTSCPSVPSLDPLGGPHSVRERGSAVQMWQEGQCG